MLPSGGGNLEKINERIAQVVKMSSLTKTAFAAKLNVSQGFISQLCSGLSVPSDRTITDICRVFNINRNWLETGEGDMRPEADTNAELSTKVGMLLKDEPESFRQRFINALLDLDSDGWGLLEQICNNIEKKMNRPED